MPFLLLPMIHAPIHALIRATRRWAQRLAREQVGAERVVITKRRLRVEPAPRLTLVCDARQVSTLARLVETGAHGLHVRCLARLYVGDVVRCAGHTASQRPEPFEVVWMRLETHGFHYGLLHADPARAASKERAA